MVVNCYLVSVSINSICSKEGLLDKSLMLLYSEGGDSEGGKGDDNGGELHGRLSRWFNFK